MKKGRSILSAALVIVVLSGCDTGVRSQGTIHLPQGDPEQGKAEFIALDCIACHTVVGVDLPEPEGSVRVLLGSSVRITSYGDLVTSVVNPTHKLSGRYLVDGANEDGESRMVSYNDVMTVTQLADVIAFLQQHYQRIERPGYQYRRYDTEIKPAAERARSGRDGGN